MKQLPAIWSRLALRTMLIMLGMAALSAHAQTYYFPGTNYTYTGGANSWPLNATPTSGSNMCQWLYTPSDFNTTPPSNYNITTIYLKPAATGTYSFTNLSIKMANTSLTTLTSGTWNSGLTTVYNPSSASFSTTSGSWFAITLSTPFYYTGGNILLEITHQNSSSVGLTLNQFTVSGRNGRMYGSSSNTSSSGADGATALFGFDGAPAACSGAPSAATINTAPFTAAQPLCSGSTTTITATNPNLGTGYILQWEQASASTGPWSSVTTGSGATTTSYTTGAITANTYFRLNITCTNSSMSTASAAFLVPIGTAQPSVITGPLYICPGDPFTYSVTNVSGTTYSWTLPTGWSGASTTNSITITPNSSTSGTISVTATSSCGPTSIARSLTLSSSSAPSGPVAINGPSSSCPNSSQTYSVAAVTGATSYQWTLPSGWTGTSTTNTINVTTSTSGGNIIVRAINGCGQSSPASLSVNIVLSLTTPVLSGKDSVCSGNLEGFSIAAVPGATSYVWTLPSGWSGTTSGTSIQTFVGTASGTLSVTAYSSCATSLAASKFVKVNATVNPAVTISRNASVLCSSRPNTWTATPVNGGGTPTYQWTKNGVNVGTNSPVYSDASVASGDRIQVKLSSSATCAASPVVSSNTDTATVTATVTPGININTVPPIIVCAGTTVVFTTNRTGAGTLPHYQWYKNGNILVGDTLSTYTTAALLNTDTLTVVMTSSAPCVTTPTANSNKVGITINPIVTPSVSIAATPSDVAIQGQDITFTATQSNGGATPGYQWMLNGVDIPFETSNTYVGHNLQAGDQVSVKMLSYDPCPSPNLVSSNIVTLKADPLGIATVGGWDGNISLYPNPTTGRFTISASWNAAHMGKRVSIDIINALGQSVYHSEVAPDRTAWHSDVNLTESIANGRYMLRLSGDGMRSTQPFLLQR